MEAFLFNSGLGWTISKVLPYVIFFLVGVALMIFARKKIKNRKLRIASISLLFTPVGVYFMLCPIYESDFSNDFRSMDPVFDISQENQLTVIAIPNCPFCQEALDRLLKMQIRTASNTINFKVLTSDSLAIETYEDKANGLVNVIMETDFEPHEKISEASFPTYVYSSSTESRVWHNDQIGTRGLDWLEDQLIQD
jgi:hypothetical protein